MKPLIITVNNADKLLIQLIIEQFKQRHKRVLFAKKAESLDIDTPEKDSYELFNAGLDFSMLVTDRHHYLKSKQDLSQYVSLSSTDVVVQNEALYPSDIYLNVIEHCIFFGEEQFAINDISPLIDDLEQHTAS